jgi:hypothetical protein
VDAQSSCTRYDTHIANLICCEVAGVNPNEIFLCGGCDEPHPNRHNHLGYAESFIKAAESLGYKLCCSTNRLCQVGHRTHQVYGAIHNFPSKPSHAPSRPTDSDQNASRFSRNVLHG